MRSGRLVQGLLLLTALLAPIFGGYVASDATTVAPGSLLTAMGEGQAPILQHALLALPIVLAMVLLLVGRRVLQIPNPYVAGALMLVVGGLGPAVAISAYRAVSVNVWIEWTVYAVAFLACVAGLGRRVGPLALLGAVALGTSWIARIGVLEYLDMRHIDPTWRVFCNWNNPNAAAAMLTLGFLCALGLPRMRERSAELLMGLGVTIGGGLILCALLLTGSKGGTLLALPTGLMVFGLVAGRRHPATYPVAAIVLALAAVGFLKSLPALGVGSAFLFAAVSLWPHRVHVGRLGAAFAFGGLMLGFFASTTPGGHGATTGATRIGAASATQDQSATFRLNLWRSALTLAKERPATGWGLGSYRYESARPGLVTATVFAHDSYLQLAAEAGFGVLFLFLAFLAIWGRRTLRASSHLPDETRLAFGAAVGGVAAILAHCLVDSDLSYFGLGLAFFLVLGAATTLAADAVAPEFIPCTSRLVAAGGVAALGLLFVSLGQSDVAKSEVRLVQKSGQAADLSPIGGLTGWDGDAAYLWALGQADPEPALRRAYELLPTPKVARALAEVQKSRHEYAEAEGSLYPALVHDPNNLPTLYLLMVIQDAAGEPEQALGTAHRLLSVEGKSYFKIRSLDQVVPTETYLARFYIARFLRDSNEKARLLAGGVEGMRRYAQIMVPQVVKASQSNSTFAGESMQKATDRLRVGVEAASTATSIFNKAGEMDRANRMREDHAILMNALSKQ